MVSSLAHRRCFVALVALFLCLSFANATENAIDASQLTGVWQYKDDKVAGGLEAYSICDANGTQVNIAYLVRLNRWVYQESTWKLEGNTIFTTATRSNVPDVTPGSVIKTEILHLDHESMTCREDGADHVEHRVEHLPAAFQAKLDELRRVTPATGAR